MEHRWPNIARVHDFSCFTVFFWHVIHTIDQLYHQYLYKRTLLLGSYFSCVDISFDKIHFTCIWIVLSGFNNIMKHVSLLKQVVLLKTWRLHNEASEEQLNMQVPIPTRYLLIYQDLMKLDTWFDTSRSIELQDFRI